MVGSTKARQAGISEAFSGLDAIGRIWRRRRIFGVAFAAVIGLAVLALILLPVRYLATASVIVAEQEPGDNNVSAVWAQKVGDPADLESQLLVIRSPRLLRLTIDAPGVIPAIVRECERAGLLGAAGSCEQLKTDIGAAMDHIDGRFSVASAGRSRVINISYQSSIPDVAQTLANALTQVFLEDQRNEGANSREVATSWLWKELKQLDQQIRDADEKIQTFRRTKGLMRGANAPISSERLTSIGQQLSQAEAARAEAAARLQEIKSEQARGPTDAPSVLSSRSIADLKQQLTTVSAQLASAAGVLGPKHPSILALTREQTLISAASGRRDAEHRGERPEGLRCQRCAGQFAEDADGRRQGGSRVGDTRRSLDREHGARHRDQASAICGIVQEGERARDRAAGPARQHAAGQPRRAAEQAIFPEEDSVPGRRRHAGADLRHRGGLAGRQDQSDREVRTRVRRRRRRTRNRLPRKQPRHRPLRRTRLRPIRRLRQIEGRICPRSPMCRSSPACRG